MRASEQPDTRGPLNFDGKDCVKDVDSTTSGLTAVVTKGCSFSYDLRRGKDGSNARDYGVFWFQVTVDPRNGFCLTDATTTIRVPRGYKIEGQAPKQADLSGNQYRARLAVRGGGQRERAVVKNTFTPRGNSYDAIRDGKRFTVDWDGATRRTFAVAMGLEVSYEQGDLPAGSATASTDSELRSSC